MKVVVRNSLAKIPGYSFMPKTYTFEGQIVSTPKWVNYPAIALTTFDEKFPVRIIAQEDIISIDNEGYESSNKNNTKRVFEVTGSKGNSYIVTVDGSVKTCTCPAFIFRKSCKHTVEIK